MRIIETADKLPVVNKLIGIGRVLLVKIFNYRHNWKLRYIPYRKQPLVWWRNRKVQYRIINLKKVLEYKKSDTIFLLGTGPSLNNITQKQWDIIIYYFLKVVNY